MNKTILVPGKAPFNSGLIFSVLTKILGEPTEKRGADSAGYHDYFWELPHKERRLEIVDLLSSIENWLTCFDIQFTGFRCDIAKWLDAPNPNMDYLRITIRLPPKDE